MIRHIVLCRFRQDAGEGTIEAVFAGLRALVSIPGTLKVSTGPNVSPEGHDKGFRHGFTVEFEDAAARDRYLADPDHAKAGGALVAALEGGTDGLIVVDLEV